MIIRKFTALIEVIAPMKLKPSAAMMAGRINGRTTRDFQFPGLRAARLDASDRPSGSDLLEGP